MKTVAEKINLEVFDRTPRQVKLCKITQDDFSIDNILGMIKQKTQRDATLLEAVCDQISHL